MAKGNDGNYLQHSVEVAVATHLVEGRDGIHVALSHGMAPFESFGDRSPGTADDLLKGALQAARGPSVASESPLVAAYRATASSPDHYPNSAELLRAVVGAGGLSGGITEVELLKYAALQEAWGGTAVVAGNASWRSEVGPGGALSAPARPDVPWLFSMDPMTYKEAGEVDDCNLHRADLERLTAVLESYASSSVPGVALLFVYNMWPVEVRRQFWEFASELARGTGLALVGRGLRHRGGSRNLAAILYPPSLEVADWLPEGLDVEPLQGG